MLILLWSFYSPAGACPQLHMQDVFVCVFTAVICGLHLTIQDFSAAAHCLWLET